MRKEEALALQALEAWQQGCTAGVRQQDGTGARPSTFVEIQHH